MYIVPIAWLYVTILMAVTEATSTNGTVLGAVITFLLYGLLPMGLVVYVMGTPARRRAIKAREQAELLVAQTDPISLMPSVGAQPSGVTSTVEPDAGTKAPTDAVAAVRKEA